MKNTLIPALRGTRDFYPEDMRKRRSLLNSLRKTIELYGYDEYDAPLLESFDLYAAKSSPEIIERQSYVFEDRGGDRIVVRPEMTPSIARMIAARQRELPSVLRWYSFPECWRYERPQKGRLRNFLQANIDLIGSDSIEADVEVIDLALSMVRNLGIDMSKVEVRINDRRLLESWLTDAGVIRENQANALSLLDEKDNLEPDAFRTRLLEFSSPESADALIQKLNLSPEALSADEKAVRLCGTQKQLAKLGWQDNVKIDATIIRGFVYYTGIVFEVYETSGEFRRAIFGGGRYDGLVEALGGSPVSAIGFGVSDVSLEELLLTQNKTLKDTEDKTVMLIPFSDAQAEEQSRIATVLRKNDIVTATSFPPYGFSPQLKLAQKKKIETVILLAPEELEVNNVIVRNLKTGSQEVIAIDNLVDYCKQLTNIN
jgi:histidyl-tRNA synthetase